MKTQSKYSFLCLALALTLAACQKQNVEQELPGAPELDDAGYFLDGLVKETSEGYIPIQGSLTEGGLIIPVASVFEAERHFRSLLPPDAEVREEWDRLVWTPDDEKNISQGNVVFTILKDHTDLVRVSLPDAFPEQFRVILYRSASTILSAVNPDVQEDLEDNYYYGAIVNISDHGCGSGKFVVFREYNFSNGAAGMAVRIDGHRWDTPELNKSDNAARVYGRASCLSTLRQAGDIYRKDRTILSKQLRNAGCTALDQHYASSNQTWNGWHYYYCLHDDECDWIGPINDTAFYECWIYWFVPSGNGINFW